ncbi:hypothetical protein HanIR_Chr12g0576341 [Helianthus annuus]|nr:hypothetical protein HanIR_Chr12g0576341 [Helianthus annuus]
MFEIFRDSIILCSSVSHEGSMEFRRIVLSSPAPMCYGTKRLTLTLYTHFHRLIIRL